MSENDPNRGEGLPQPGEIFGDLSSSLKKDLADYLDDLLVWRMPFGRYKNAHVDELPFEYLHWFALKNGFPSGRLGELMEFVYHTKHAGAGAVFTELKRRRTGSG